MDHKTEVYYNQQRNARLLLNGLDNDDYNFILVMQGGKKINEMIQSDSKNQ